MSLLAPLGLLLFGLAAPLILLYLLKQKREDRVVSSTLLWRKVVEDIQARHPFQRLRANLLLLLQLAVLAALAIGLARPVLRATHRGTRATAIVLDISASMLAREADGRTRFERARASARDLARSLLPGDRGMLVLAGRTAKTTMALTTETEDLVKALDEARAQETHGELRDAAVLAVSALKPFGAAGEVHVFSDGTGRALDTSEPDLASAGAGGVPVKLHVFGASRENAGITGLDVARGRDGRVEVFATVENAGSSPQKRFVTLFHEAKAVASRAVDLAPGAAVPVVFREKLEPGRITVRIEGEDALACDDAAYAVLPPNEPIDVAIVGTSHAALERALATAGNVRLFVLPKGAAAGDPSYRLVIYDGLDALPTATGRDAPPPLPARPVLIFGARAGLPGVHVGAEVGSPEITGWERDHPLLRFVDLGGVAIARARTLSLDGPGRPLIRSDKGLLAVESRARRDPLIAFGIDIRESTFAADEAFPVFILNVLQMVMRQGGALGPERIETGEPLSVRAPRSDALVTLVRPSGERVARAAIDGRADFLETGEGGFYTIESEGRRQTVAVNLLDREETRIAARAASTSGAAAVRAEAPPGPSNREVWRWFAVAALLGLVVEWWAFHRRI